MNSVMSASEAPVLPALSALQFEADLIALIPQLRAFSRLLCARRSISEDMAQDALTKAWRAQASFEPGTNLRAWLFAILRNEYYSHGRRAWREMHWDEVLGDRIAAPTLEQEWSMELSDTARALDGLNKEQRDALILVAAGGFTLRDAAKFCAASVGTIKSRVARARDAVRKSLNGEKPMLPRSGVRAADTTDNILAQLTALAPGAMTSAARALCSRSDCSN
jgi:RNA polymerase sigma-70 factor (ECF subfamily)